MTSFAWREGRRRAAAAPRRVEVLYGIHPVTEALRARRRELRRLRIRRGARRPELLEVAAEARGLGIPVDEVAAEEIAAAAGPGRASQGVLLEAGSLPEMELDQLWAATEDPVTVVALDGVEDPQNLGAVARVAEAAGVAGLILTRRHAPPLSPAVSQASAGAIEWLATARVPNLGRALKLLKQNGFWVFGCDPEGATDVFQLPSRALPGKRVVVLGGEGRGLRPGIRRGLDHALRIPSAGRVASLNVASAAAVVLFELERRRRLALRG